MNNTDESVETVEFKIEANYQRLLKEFDLLRKRINGCSTQTDIKSCKYTSKVLIQHLISYTKLLITKRSFQWETPYERTQNNEQNETHQAPLYDNTNSDEIPQEEEIPFKCISKYI